MQTRRTNWFSFLPLIIAGLLPVWFLPITPDPFSFQKQYLFLAFVFVTLLLWVAQTLRERRVVITLTPLTVASVALTAVALLGGMLQPNRPFQLSNNFLTLAALSLTLVFGPTVYRSLRWQQLLRVWLIPAGVLSALLLLQLTPWRPLTLFFNNVFGYQFPSVALLTPIASQASPYVLLGFLTTVAIANLVHGNKTRHQEHGPLAKFLETPVLPLLSLLAVGATIMTLVLQPESRPAFLPYSYAWGIAVENFKSLSAFLVGVGPENFLAAFHRSREVSYNMTNLWDSRFLQSSSELLQLLTTLGALGFLAALGIWGTLFSFARRIWKQEPSLLVFAALMLAQFVFLPWSALNYALLALLGLALLNEVRHAFPEIIKDAIILLSAILIVPSGEARESKSPRAFAVAVAIVVALATLLSGYTVGKLYAASFTYQQAILAANKNDIPRSYDLQQRAVNFAPHLPLYRQSYITTNLTLAQTLSQQQSLSAEQQEFMGRLVQEAISQARLNASLHPQQTESWELVALVYSSLLSVEGAPQWATAATVQAIQTDPISPLLRMSLGTLYLNLNETDQALRLYEQAIQLKPNWATGFYNYALALERDNQLELAKQSLEKAASLLPEDSADRQQVNTKLAEIEQKLKNKKVDTGEEASLPASDTPSVPEQPKVENPPSDFTNLIEGQTPSPTPTPGGQGSNNGDGSIVLPENVGF